MDWERAKKFCFLFLIVLNIFLFISINIFGDKYELDFESKKAVVDLLEKNNLAFDGKLKKFSPKRDISVEDYKFNFDDLKKLFLNFGAKNIRLDVFDKNGFDCSFKLKKKLGMKEIKKTCDAIIGQINFLAEANFVLDDVKNNFLIYRDRYNGFFLMDNFIGINVYSNYEIEIECRYKKINGFFGDRFEIYSPDLVLYEFIKCEDVIKKEPKVINKFELVYKIKDDFKKKFLVAEPIYLIVYNNNYEKYLDAYLK